MDYSKLTDKELKYLEREHSRMVRFWQDKVFQAQQHIGKHQKAIQEIIKHGDKNHTNNHAKPMQGNACQNK